MNDFHEVTGGNFKWATTHDADAGIKSHLQSDIMLKSNSRKTELMKMALTPEDKRFETGQAVCQLALADLQALYKDHAGTTFAESDLPELIMIDASHTDGLKEIYPQENRKSSDVFYDHLNNCCIVTFDGFDLRTAANIHHELHHALGQKVEVIGGFSTALGVAGHSTMSGPKAKDHPHWVARGEVIEEGMMEYYARKFVLDSNDEIFKNLKEQAVSSVKALPTPKNIALNPNDRLLADLFLSTTVSENYNSARLLIWRILSAASKKGTDQLQSIRRSLLLARIDGKEKYQLIKSLNGLIGADFGQRIYKAQLNDDEIKGLLSSIE